MTQETRDDVNSCITGFLSLCKYVIPQGIPIKPFYFNSDILENFFGQQRGQRNGTTTNPTVEQYGPGVNACILSTMSVSRKSNTGGARVKPLSLSKKRSIRV